MSYAIKQIITHSWVSFMGVLIVLSPSTYAQNTDLWPQQAIKFIIPQGPGGGVDTFGRMFAKELAIALRQPVVVENKAGAAANLGAEFVARATADGYTMLYGLNQIATMNPHLYSQLRFDALTDLVPVTQTIVGGYVLAVNNDLPVRNVSELVEYAKRNPGKLTFASYGVGSGSHLSTELLMQRTGIQMVHAPYKQSPMPDLMAGHIQVFFEASSLVQSAIRSGKVRGLAVTKPERMSALPDVPTLSETYPGLAVAGWHGIWVPKGTPSAIVERINKEVVTIIKSPDMQKRIADMDVQASGTSISETKAIIQRESRMWGDVIKKLELKLD